MCRCRCKGGGARLGFCDTAMHDIAMWWRYVECDDLRVQMGLSVDILPVGSF